MNNKILITAALPYANGPLHFGHIAGAYLPADCYARFQRLKGQNVLFICGSDEYGVAITLNAELAGRSPQEHVDIFHEVIKGFFKKLGLSFDHYSRTTWPGHVETVQQFFLDLRENGYIEERITDQLYSEQEHRFLADRYVVGTCPKCGYTEARGDECGRCGASFEATDLIAPRSKLTNSPLIKKATKNWFLRFDLFKDKLAQWIAAKAWKPNVVNFAQNYIDDLKPRAITRDTTWGVPLPIEGASDKAFYVWFDAPIGYISATKEWALLQKRPDAWKDYWYDPQTKYVQFIGKDNIPFHAVFFPAMVMGQNDPYKLVDELPANEFYNLEGKQFSKSEGWMIDLESFFDNFSADQIRYVIAANAPENQDSEFTWKDFQSRCNSELLGKYANLANRTLVFIADRLGGKIPSVASLPPQDQEFLARVTQLADDVAASFDSFRLRKACQLIMEIAAIGNTYFDAQKPWVLAKDPAQRQRLEEVIYSCLECLKVLALVSAPIIPDTAQKLWHLLGYKHPLTNWEKIMSEQNPSGQTLPPPNHLFPKIEDATIDKEIAKLPTAKKGTEITIDDVRKVDLRIGQIEAAERIPKSKKLLKLSVNLGSDKRTIVAGIGEKLEDISTLIGKKVVIVANLKPSTLMGVESQGMLLAAHGSLGLELPSVEQVEPGSTVS